MAVDIHRDADGLLQLLDQIIAGIGSEQTGHILAEGCFAVAVAADNAATGARVVWVNCPNLLESNINQAVSGGNAQFLGSVVNWMNGEQTTAVINAKSMSAASLSVPTSAAIPLGVLFTLVLPIVCIIAGAVVCVVRRRR